MEAKTKGMMMDNGNKKPSVFPHHAAEQKKLSTFQYIPMTDTITSSLECTEQGASLVDFVQNIIVLLIHSKACTILNCGDEWNWSIHGQQHLQFGKVKIIQSSTQSPVQLSLAQICSKFIYINALL